MRAPTVIHAVHILSLVCEGLSIKLQTGSLEEEKVSSRSDSGMIQQKACSGRRREEVNAVQE